MKKSCVNFIPRNKIYLGIIYDNLKQTWEPRIPNVTFLRINLQSMKQGCKMFSQIQWNGLYMEHKRK